MKLNVTRKEKPKFAPPPEPEEEQTVDLDSMDRAELKALIAEHELEIAVTKGMSDDDIRTAIAEKLSDSAGGDESGGESGDSAGEGSGEEASGESAGEESSSGSAEEGRRTLKNWMFTGKDLDKEAQRSASMRRPFTPSFFVPDGESRVVRFRDDTPVCGCYMYSAHNGRRWDKYTQPVNPEEDLFAKAGKTPCFYMIYELLDRSEWTDKQGTKHKDTARFWLVTEKVHKMLQHVRAKCGSLTKQDFEIHREGGQKPVYQVMPDTSLPAPKGDVLKQPRLSAEIKKYFTPPSVEEQRRLLRADEDNAAE